MYYADDNLVVNRQRDGDADEGETVDKVGGAVEGVDEPRLGGRERVGAASSTLSFLADDEMRGESCL